MELFVLVATFLVLAALWIAVAVRRWQHHLEEDDYLEENYPTITSIADGNESQPRQDGSRGPVPDEPGTCRICGTENDPEYTFCRNCLSRIGGG